MPPYNRYPGEQVRYSQVQTSLYKSQRIRWLKGLTYSPNIVIHQNDGMVLLRYRSYRATDGFWETLFNPSGFLPGEPGSPGSPGSAPICGLPSPGSCLNDRLAYLKVTTFYTQRRECYSQDGSPNFVNQDTVTEVFYVLAPGGGVNPPNDGLPKYGASDRQEHTGSYPVGCNNGLIVPFTYSYGDEYGSSGMGWYFFKYDESADKVYRYTLWNFIISRGDTPFIVDPAAATICKFEGYSGSLSAQFVFVNDATINDHSYCRPGNPGAPPTPSDPDINRPLRYKCDCPDFTKQAQALPWSRYTSELSDRLIPGNTHTGAIGPCKHVYSAGNVVGERFVDPASVSDPWTLQDYPPRTIVLDWLDPIPPTLNGDNNIEQLRQWREERRLRRRNAYTQSTTDFNLRQAEAKKKREEYFNSIIGNTQRIEDLSESDYNQFVEFRDRQSSNRQQWTLRNQNTRGHDNDGSSS